MEIATYTGQTAACYNAPEARSHPLNLLVHQTWLRELGDIRGAHVLDIACAGGVSTRLLDEREAFVIGVDKEEDMIRFARAAEGHKEPVRRIQYHVCDAAELDLGRRFDIVTPTFLFHYAETKERMCAMMTAARNHLPPGGRLVALNAWSSSVPRMPNGSHWTEWITPDQANVEGAGVRLHILDDKGREVLSIEYYHWEQATYEELLRTCGYNDIRWIYHQIPETLRACYPNWRDLEAVNASCVLTARRA